MAGKRGTYAKTAARREEILNIALELIARNGYSKATLKEVADAAGLSQMGVLHHFKTKEELFVDVLKRRDSRSGSNVDILSLSDQEALQHFQSNPDRHVDSFLTEVARKNSAIPGLISLFTRLLAEATEPEHSAHPYFLERTATMRRFIELAVKEEQRNGYIAESVDPKVIAVSYIALMDGLQTLWLYDPSIDMEEHIRAYWDQVRSKPQE